MPDYTMGARLHRSHAFDALQMRFPATEYVASLAMVPVISLHFTLTARSLATWRGAYT
jgi:hypothetical protein